MQLAKWLFSSVCEADFMETKLKVVFGPHSFSKEISHYISPLVSFIKSSAEKLCSLSWTSILILISHLKSHSVLFLRNSAKIKPLLSSNDLELLVLTFIFSGICQSLLASHQLGQNAGARLLTKTSHEIQNLFKILLLTHEALHGQAPACISKLLRRSSSSNQGLLSVPPSYADVTTLMRLLLTNFGTMFLSLSGQMSLWFVLKSCWKPIL